MFLSQTQQVGSAGEVSRWMDMWFRSRRPGLVRSHRPLLAACSKYRYLLASMTITCFCCRWWHHLSVDLWRSPPGLWPGSAEAWNSSTPAKSGARSWWRGQIGIPVFWWQVLVGGSRTGDPGMHLRLPAEGARGPLLAGVSVRLQRRWFIGSLTVMWRQSVKF